MTFVGNLLPLIPLQACDLVLPAVLLSMLKQALWVNQISISHHLFSVSLSGVLGGRPHRMPMWGRGFSGGLAVTPLCSVATSLRCLSQAVMARCAQLPIIPAPPTGKSEETQGDGNTHLLPGSGQAVAHLSTDDDDDDVTGSVDHE